MLQITQRRLNVPLNVEQAHSICAKLQDRHNSLLAGVRLEYLRRLGVDQADDSKLGFSNASTLQAGEIFLSSQGTVFFLKVSAADGLLEAGGVSSSATATCLPFLKEVGEAVSQVTGQLGEWSDCTPQTFNEPEDARIASLEVSEKELEAAQEFLKPSSLELLQQLNQQDSLPLRKLKFPGGDPTRLLAHLEDLDLVRKDYAVISRETGQQILKVSSRTSLEESKFFSAENVDEVISCTAFCQDLLRNDQWLLILVLSQLREMGIADFGDDILVSQSDGAPTQVFLGLNQQRFLLVLSNKRLSIDDSYVVSAQISACNLEEVVLISTQKISSLMKHHLSSTNPNAKFHFIDGLKELQDKLRNVIVEKQRSYLRSILDPLSELTPVQIPELVVARMSPPTQEFTSPVAITGEKLTLPNLQLDPEPQPAETDAAVTVGNWSEPEPHFEEQHHSAGLGEEAGFDFSPSLPDLEPDLPEANSNFELPPLGLQQVNAPVHPVNDDFGSFGSRGRSLDLPLD
jgi:hypothetical protein